MKRTLYSVKFKSIFKPEASMPCDKNGNNAEMNFISLKDARAFASRQLGTPKVIQHTFKDLGSREARNFMNMAGHCRPLSR